MSTRWIFIRPKEPLIIGRVKPKTNFIGTMDYIPGRILRGAYAEWLISRGETHRIIDAVDGVLFGNFLPTALWGKIDYVSPFLLSMLTCKLEDGFKTEPHDENRGHGVVDTLLPRLCCSLLKKSGAALSVPFSILCQSIKDKDEEEIKQTPCNSRMEPASGFFSSQRNNNTQRYIKTRLRYYSQTRAALSRYRQSAFEGMLYTATAISPLLEDPEKKYGDDADLAFTGRIQGPEEKVDEIVEALNGRSIGSMNTRGYGRIRCEDESIRIPPLEDRLRRFNETLKELWQDLKRLCSSQSIPEQPVGLYFSVDLLAPGIFRDEHGLPTLVPTLKIRGKPLKPVFCMTRPDFAGGWSGAWGLPKETALAAKMGSSFVFCWDGSKDDLLADLERIESEGISDERRDEGYGECLVCHPFHEEVNER